MIALFLLEIFFKVGFIFLFFYPLCFARPLLKRGHLVMCDDLLIYDFILILFISQTIFYIFVMLKLALLLFTSSTIFPFEREVPEGGRVRNIHFKYFAISSNTPCG